MSKRMTIATPRKGKDGKTFWTNIGSAWFNDNGGIQLVFDALPLPDAEGRCVANLFEPRDNSGGRDTGQRTQQRQPASQYDDLNEDAPF
jgi:hypothetical protein